MSKLSIRANFLCFKKSWKFCEVVSLRCICNVSNFRGKHINISGPVDGIECFFMVCLCMVGGDTLGVHWSPSGSSSGHPLLLSSASESSDSFSDLLVFSYRPLAIFIVMIIFKMMFTRRTRRHSFKLQLCQCDRSLPIPAPG